MEVHRRMLSLFIDTIVKGLLLGVGCQNKNFQFFIIDEFIHR